MFYTLSINQEHDRDQEEEEEKTLALEHHQVAARHRYSTSIPPSLTGGLETLLSSLRTTRAASTDRSSIVSVDDELRQYREAMIDILIHINAAQDAVNAARRLAGLSITSLPKH